MAIPDFRNDDRRRKLNNRIFKRKEKVHWNSYIWFFYRRKGKLGVGVHEIDKENMFKDNKKE